MSAFPNIPKITKNVLLMAWDFSKVFTVDMILWIVTLAAIIAYALDKQDRFSLDGAAAVLFCYIFYAVYRLMGSRKIIKDQRALIDKLTKK